jgi:hypothetical protein
MEVQGGESELVASRCSDQHEWIAITITKRLLFVIGGETLRQLVGRSGGDRKQQRLEFQGLSGNAREH